MISSIFIKCGAKQVFSPVNYIKYINDEVNGLVVEREFNKIVYKAKLQPCEMIVLNNSIDKIKSDEQFRNEVSLYKGKLNFVFNIEDSKDGTYKVRELMFSKASYGKLLSYANVSLINDFKLLQGSDTLYCSIAHLESANSVQPIVRISLAFKGLDTLKKNDLTLLYNDNIFLNGPLKFHFSMDALNKIPEIKF